MLILIRVLAALFAALLVSLGWTLLALITPMIPVLTALLTPTIAALAVLIAYEQFVVNKRHYRLALFEKRYAIFDAAAKFIASILQEANVTLPQCIKLLQDTKDSNFLFGTEVNAFITEVYNKAVELHTYVAVGNHGEQLVEAEKWFSGQIERARQIFGRYLDFRSP